MALNLRENKKNSSDGVVMTAERRSLIEKYNKQLSEADAFHRKAHQNHSMDTYAKLTTATMLDNITKLFNQHLGESWDNTVATQASDMGNYKKFCIAVTQVAFPSSIAEDLVMVYPMTSYSGSVAYAKYTYSTNKGGITQGQAIADFSQIYERDEDNTRYTSSSVVEPFTGDGSTTAFTLTPAFTRNAVIQSVTVAGTEVTDYTYADGVVTLSTAPESGAAVRIAYVYDNTYIPQKDIPTVGVHMEHIPLEAKLRRVAVYYSQIAAYQAQTDYGFDITTQLAQTACAELSYEIDEEIVRFLAALGDEHPCEAATFNTTRPYGVSLADHYQSFLNSINVARTELYKKTYKFYPNYMLISPDVLPILELTTAFKSENTEGVAGPFFAGTVLGMKVFVSPALDEGKWYLGVNGKDFTTSAAVFAPYMPIAPTQLLGFADGSMSQGFSTMYDLKALNSQLVISGTIVSTENIVYTQAVN